MNRPEITGMPGQPVYIDQMSNPQYISRIKPSFIYPKEQVNPLGVNLRANAPGLGFTPSSGLIDTSEMQPMPSESEDALIAAAGERFKTPNQLGFMPGGSRAPVVIEDRMAQDNPNYRAMATAEDVAVQADAAGAQAEPAAQGAAPRRTLGLLGDMFGGASALDEYMTPEQKAQLQNQGVMAAAMQLLAASGPSRTPIGLGQALGQAYGAGQQGYQGAQQNLMQSIAMKQKMDEYKRARDIEARISGALVGEGAPAMPGAAITPEQAILMTGTGTQGPTNAAAALIGTQAPATATQPMSQADILHDRYMKASTIAAQYGDPTKAKAYSDLAKQARPTDEVIGEPFRGNDGNFYQRLKSGGTIPFKGVSPIDKPVGEPFRAADGNYYQRTESGGTVLFSEGAVKPADKPVGEPFRAADGNYYQRTESGSTVLFGNAQVRPAAKPMGQPQQQLVDGKAQMVQYYDDGTFKPIAGVSQVAKPVGQPQMQVVNGVPTMMQYFDDGTSKPLAGVSSYREPSSLVTNIEYITGKALANTGAAGLAALEKATKASATSISINTGEKGFKNEFDLSKEFKNEPVYKDLQGMKSALSAVQESLKKENPIGDVAAATKIMKLLDPGSVVRESELGIAMAASGKLDRISNYVDMWKKGTLLTPTQRAEFGALANELYNASARAYNDKRGEYAAFGAKYQIDANTALGNTAPVIPYTPPAAAGAAGRPPLSSIIRPRGVQ
jgi:hypothetical protein